MTVSRRPTSEWYSPYFAPTTVIIAITVLFISVEAGKYVGNYYVQRDRAALVATPVTGTVPAVRRAPTKTTLRRSHSRTNQPVPSKTSH